LIDGYLLEEAASLASPLKSLSDFITTHVKPYKGDYDQFATSYIVSAIPDWNIDFDEQVQPEPLPLKDPVPISEYTVRGKMRELFGNNGEFASERKKNMIPSSRAVLREVTRYGDFGDAMERRIHLFYKLRQWCEVTKAIAFDYKYPKVSCHALRDKFSPEHSRATLIARARGSSRELKKMEGGGQSQASSSRKMSTVASGSGRKMSTVAFPSSRKMSTVTIAERSRKMSTTSSQNPPSPSEKGEVVGSEEDLLSLRPHEREQQDEIRSIINSVLRNYSILLLLSKVANKMCLLISRRGHPPSIRDEVDFRASDKLAAESFGEIPKAATKEERAAAPSCEDKADRVPPTNEEGESARAEEAPPPARPRDRLTSRNVGTRNPQ
jgi:hypothetical protein